MMVEECSQKDIIVKLQDDITDLKVKTSEQKTQMINLKEDIGDLSGVVKEDMGELKTKLDTFISKMENGFIAKKVQETIYSGVGKYIVGFFLANLATIIGLVLAIIKGAEK